MGGAKSKATTYAAPAARTVLARRQQEVEAIANAATTTKQSHLVTPTSSSVKPDFQHNLKVNIENNELGSKVDASTTLSQESASVPSSRNTEHASPLSPEILKEVSKWAVKKTIDKVISQLPSIHINTDEQLDTIDFNSMHQTSKESKARPKYE
jgi:hypothetical protein